MLNGQQPMKVNLVQDEDGGSQEISATPNHDKEDHADKEHGRVKGGRGIGVSCIFSNDSSEVVEHIAERSQP